MRLPLAETLARVGAIVDERCSAHVKLVSGLREVMGSAASLPVRVAASRALGSLTLSVEQRAAIAGDSRVNVQG